MKKVEQSETTNNRSKSILPMWMEVNWEGQHVHLGRTDDYESTYIPFDKIPALIHVLKEI